MKATWRIRRKQKTLVSCLPIKNAIRKDDLLWRFLGSYSASSRVKGWGNYHGYIQVEPVFVDSETSNRREYREGDRKIIYETQTDTFTAEVKLFAQHDHDKEGWTDEHQQRLLDILKKFGVELSA